MSRSDMHEEMNSQPKLFGHKIVLSEHMLNWDSQ